MSRSLWFFLHFDVDRVLISFDSRTSSRTALGNNARLEGVSALGQVLHQFGIRFNPILGRDTDFSKVVLHLGTDGARLAPFQVLSIHYK